VRMPEDDRLLYVVRLCAYDKMIHFLVFKDTP
jgi:hypothetical protein